MPAFDTHVACIFPKKVLGEEDGVMRARLLLVEATRIVVANCLRLLGISAPERM